MSFDDLLLLGLFNKAISGKDKNSNLFAKKALSPMLPPSIMPRELSNPLLGPSGNYGKLKNRKSRAALTSWSLEDSSYITDQAESQGAFAMSKNNTNNTKSSWRNQTQKGSSIIRE